MFGLAILIVMGLYLLISVGVVRWAIRYARKNGKSAKRWGWGAALGMYLLVFWDWIPTVVTHQYSCSTEAGFWVYKTPEQWKKENPGVMETLVYNKNMPYVQTPYGGAATALNQRVLSIYKHEGPFLFNRWRMESEIRDSKTGELIAREIRFSTSQERRQAGWSGWKFWLDSERCNIEKHRDQGSFDKITAQFEGAKK
jgi:hypothetical protein